MQIDRPIAIAVTLFVILILLFSFVVPKYHQFKDLQLKLGEKTAEFNAEYEYFSEITRAHYEIESKKDSIEKIDDALPTDSNFGRLVYFFQKKSLENGIIVTSLFLNKAPQIGVGDNVKELAFSLNLVGSYSSLQSFIISLERSSRMFEVTTISFSSGGVESTFDPASPPQFETQEIYTFNLEVKTYSY